jgi:hypothetical protein
MPIVSQVMDTFYAFRFAKLLATKWTDTDAFKLGIVDENGHQLKKRIQLNTPEEHAAYTKFVTLVFNIKRLLDKVPLGKTTLARYGAALALLRDHTEGLVNPDIYVTKLVEHTDNKDFLQFSVENKYNESNTKEGTH